MPRPSFRRTLIITFGAIATLPLLVLAFWLYYGLSHHVEETAQQKHQVLAQNLAASIGAHLAGARQVLHGTSVFIDHDDDEQLVAETLQRQPYFHAVLLITDQGIAKRWPVTAAFYSSAGDAQLTAQAWELLGGQARAHSGVLPCPYRGTPVMLFAERTASGMTVGMLDLEPLLALGRRTQVGPEGYVTIVDQHGGVVLHPNVDWMRGISNLGHWPAVRAALGGKSGTQRFRLRGEETLIAGFAPVPDFNWAVLTPQAASRVHTEHVDLVRTTLWVWVASLLAALVLAVTLSCRIARPLSKLAKTVQALPYNGYRAEFDELAKIAPRELDTLQRRSKEMAMEVRHALALRERMNRELKAKVRAATKRLQEANAKLARQALQDDLTKLNNRRALWERVSDLERARPESYLPVQVLLFDLDNFKEINDSHGHAAGDQVLSHVAGLMARETRDEDFVVRYGGDEFLIVLPHCEPEAARRRADAICEAVLAAPLDVDGQSLTIRMSVGIAQSESKLSRPSFDELLKAADQAMYAAKQHRRGAAASEGMTST
jgi:diguanylate cyclase (GGDEF)-like protein